MSDLHHLRPLRAVEKPDNRSVLFALMAAACHLEKGEAGAGWEALADALWLLHKGTHEQPSDREMIEAICRLVGFLWNPESPEGEAA